LRRLLRFGYSFAQQRTMELSQDANLMAFWPPVVAGCHFRSFLIAFTRWSKSSMHSRRSAGPGNGVLSAAG
jgi:hypothetical protein